jgi:hypothetical protein
MKFKGQLKFSGPDIRQESFSGRSRLILNAKKSQEEKTGNPLLTGFFTGISYKKGIQSLAGKILKTDYFIGNRVNGQSCLAFYACFADDILTVAHNGMNTDI